MKNIEIIQKWQLCGKNTLNLIKICQKPSKINSKCEFIELYCDFQQKESNKLKLKIKNPEENYARRLKSFSNSLNSLINSLKKVSPKRILENKKITSTPKFINKKDLLLIQRILQFYLWKIFSKRKFWWVPNIAV